MPLEPDTVEALSSDIISAIEGKDYTKALTLAAEIRGYCNGVRDTQIDWQVIQEAYQSGVKAPVLAAKYGLNPKQIYDRAFNNNWLTPRKLKKAMAPGKKKVFYPVCQKCENTFEALHGKALICPTCKAFEKQKKIQEDT